MTDPASSRSELERLEILYPAGSWLTGRVVAVVGYGVFVEPEPNVEGHVDILNFNRGRRIVNGTEDFPPVGSTVLCKVLAIHGDPPQIALAMHEDDFWAESVEIEIGFDLSDPEHPRELSTYNEYLELVGDGYEVILLSSGGKIRERRSGTSVGYYPPDLLKYTRGCVMGRGKGLRSPQIGRREEPADES